MRIKRSSGILLHITSLPSPYGIGDFGPAAYTFIDFLKASGHSHWQILPLNPTHSKYHFSPYSSFSAFAGNPLLISPELLEKSGFINLKDLPRSSGFQPQKVEFKSVSTYKERLLELAFQTFKNRKRENIDFEEFCTENESWLEDFSLYRILQKQLKEENWTSWPDEFRDRDKKALDDLKITLPELLEKEKFIQFLFFSQWNKLKKYAHENGIGFIGDVPFYVNHDSVDCWANQSYFKLDGKKQPKKLSGVPPDYYSDTGQLWGTPVYDWKALKENNYDWWVSRIRQNLFLFDFVRLDHFRAFSAAWEVEKGEKNAVDGKWIKTPGNAFFGILKKEFPRMPFIAEDLGLMDAGVYKLINKFDLPRMKVLQFAFGEDKAENPYLPFNFLSNCVVYTGTHDNTTTKNWFKNAKKETKEHVREYVGTGLDKDNVHQILHRMALSSVADLVIVPMQDILGLGKEAVMNIPGTSEGNWTWSMSSEEIPWERVEELKEWNLVYGRSPLFPKSPRPPKGRKV